MLMFTDYKTNAPNYNSYIKGATVAHQKAQG
jgi:hypothetical protein